MNIVFVEGVITGLNKAKHTYKDTELFSKYRYVDIQRKYEIIGLNW